MQLLTVIFIVLLGGLMVDACPFPIRGGGRGIRVFCTLCKDNRELTCTTKDGNSHTCGIPESGVELDNLICGDYLIGPKFVDPEPGCDNPYWLYPWIPSKYWDRSGNPVNNMVDVAVFPEGLFGYSGIPVVPGPGGDCWDLLCGVLQSVKPYASQVVYYKNRALNYKRNRWVPTVGVLRINDTCTGDLPLHIPCERKAPEGLDDLGDENLVQNDPSTEAPPTPST